MILYVYIAQGQGQTVPWGQSIYVNRNVLSLHSFVAGLKKWIWRQYYTICFHDLIHIYSPRAAKTAPLPSLPRGKQIDFNRKTLSIYHLLQVSKKSFEVWFYTFFSLLNLLFYFNPAHRQCCSLHGIASSKTLVPLLTMRNHSLVLHLYMTLRVVNLTSHSTLWPVNLVSLTTQLCITKTCLFKYTENFTSKTWKISDKKLRYFSYFCSKHRLWVLVRTASRRF